MEFVEIHSMQELFDALAGKTSQQQGPQELDAEMVDSMDAARTLQAARMTAAGASNAMSVMKQLNPEDVATVEFYRINVEARQEQSRLWLEIYDRLNTNELRAAAEAQMASWKGGPQGPFDEAVAAEESAG